MACSLQQQPVFLCIKNRELVSLNVIDVLEMQKHLWYSEIRQIDKEINNSHKQNKSRIHQYGSNSLFFVKKKDMYLMELRQ